MKTIKRIKKYFPFLRAGMKTFLIYKASVFIWFLIWLVNISFIFFLYKSLYASSPSGPDSIINGFSFYEIVFYSIFVFAYSFTVGCSNTSEYISDDIKEGTIANTLLKPVSYRLRYLFTCLGTFFIQILVLGLPVITITYILYIIYSGNSIDILNIIFNFVLFLIFSILGLIINDALGYFLGLMTFFTQHVFGLNLIREALTNFLSGAMVPFSFMGVFGKVVSYLPFSYLGSTPTLVLMNKLNGIDILIFIGVGILWIVIIEVINKLVFSSSMKKLVVQGG